MITLSKPLSASQAKAYHKEEFSNDRDNYYSQGGTIRGEWQGKLAVQWGLEGPVKEEHFERLANGRHPFTNEQMVQHRVPMQYVNEHGKTIKAVEHRAGWDATFSAPKSVSLTALVGGDERIRDAHRESVRIALDEMEHHVEARMGGNHTPEVTDKWVVAKFEHDSARPVNGYAAPQLHTHCVIFNVTETNDGRTRALQPRELYKTQQYATAVYQSELASRLKTYGYEIERGKNGAPEIKGYTREYLEANSPRRQQINEHLSFAGFQGAAAAQIAAHRTRSSKLHLSPEEMRQRHQDVAAAFGDQPDRVVHASYERGPQPQEQEEVAKQAQFAVTYARDKNFEREAVADQRDLMRDALQRSLGSATLDTIHEEFQKRERSGEFVQVAPQHDSRFQHWTTQEMLDLESANLQFMKAGQQRYQGLASEETIRSMREQGLDSHLSAKQHDAVIEILRSPDQVTGLQGSAGSGKTTSLSLIREAAKQDGYEIQGLAPTTRAARQLENAGIPSTTLQHQLTQGSQSHESTPRLYVLDESSLASTKQIHEFFERLGSQDRVLVVGDVRQHQGVEAGRPFQQMQEAGMRTAHLDEIVRQQDPVLKQAVEHLSRGEVRQALVEMSHDRKVHEIADRSERIDAIAKDYAADPHNILVISPDNHSRDMINRAIHQELQLQGTVDRPGQHMEVLSPRQDLTGAERQWASKYEIGDVLRYSRGSENLEIRAGEYATVKGVDGDRNELTVSLSDGRSVTYDPRRLQGVNVFNRKEVEFAAGDRIQFTSPFREHDIPNRELGIIEEIEPDQTLTVRLDSGKRVEFNLSEHPHVDYGYAVTSYSGQGQTADRVLIHVDTEQSANLVNERFAYVALSRGRYEAQIYTDDIGDLSESLSRQVSKSSALDSYERQLNDGGREQSALKHDESVGELIGGQGRSHEQAQGGGAEHGIDS
jgi:conjugative relaxase-like TrwC/TraI family protein